jgi:hypothetical protein
MPYGIYVILRYVHFDYHSPIITVHGNSRCRFSTNVKSIRSSQSHSTTTEAYLML